MRTNKRITDFNKNPIKFDMDRIVKRNPCVYFLLLNDEIVYIGKTVFLEFRLHEHSKNKEFNKVFFIEVDENDLFKTEKKAIEFFCPPLNISHNPNVINNNNNSYDDILHPQTHLIECSLCGKFIDISYQCNECKRWLEKQQIKLCIDCHNRYCPKDNKKTMKNINIR